jgi:hypothetical protein
MTNISISQISAGWLTPEERRFTLDGATAMSKITVTCQEWRELRRNTLQGFATIRVEELRLVIRDIAVHEKDGRRWAQPPAKPQIKDGALVTDATGKLQYFPIMEFDGRETRDAFSRAVCAAVLAHEPRAFGTDNRPAAPKPAPRENRPAFNDEIGF